MKNTPPGSGMWGKMKRNHDLQVIELSLALDLSFLTTQSEQLLCPNSQPGPENLVGRILQYAPWQ